MLTTTKTSLALLGGDPVLRTPLSLYNSIEEREIQAVTKVLRSGRLSGFLGSADPQFYGGQAVRELEQAWCEKFGVRYAVSVNSATSGLFAAMGAIGIGPGDEVIVPPWTMSATAMAPLVYGGIPVFADIDEKTFCLDPVSVRARITPRTKAILAVNLFGHPAPLAELQAIAREHNLILVEDNAQAPLASERGRYCGTVGAIGVFSLNRHKHIQTGEGGICVTDDETLATRMQLIRNHGENMVEPLGIEDPVNLIGFNYRMTELTAAVAIEQLRKVEPCVAEREETGAFLSAGVSGLEGLTAPPVAPDCRHVYYIWALRVNSDSLGVSRNVFSKALAAEGFPNSSGYVNPLYLLPIFQRRCAFAGGYPFSLSTAQYSRGICPVAERLHDKEAICFVLANFAIDAQRRRDLLHAIRKVWENRAELRDWSAR